VAAAAAAAAVEHRWQIIRYRPDDQLRERNLTSSIIFLSLDSPALFFFYLVPTLSREIKLLLSYVNYYSLRS